MFTRASALGLGSLALIVLLGIPWFGLREQGRGASASPTVGAGRTGRANSESMEVGGIRDFPGAEAAELPGELCALAAIPESRRRAEPSLEQEAEVELEGVTVRLFVRGEAGLELASPALLADLVRVTLEPLPWAGSRPGETEAQGQWIAGAAEVNFPRVVPGYYDVALEFATETLHLVHPDRASPFRANRGGAEGQGMAHRQNLGGRGQRRLTFRGEPQTCEFEFDLLGSIDFEVGRSVRAGSELRLLIGNYAKPDPEHRWPIPPSGFLSLNNVAPGRYLFELYDPTLVEYQAYDNPYLARTRPEGQALPSLDRGTVAQPFHVELGSGERKFIRLAPTEGSAEIRGTLLSQHAEPVADTPIHLQFEGEGSAGVGASGLANVTRTDERGAFSFAGLPAGEYRVVPDPQGYASYLAPGELRFAERPREARVSLSTGETRQLEPLRVRLPELVFARGRIVLPPMGENARASWIQHARVRMGPAGQREGESGQPAHRTWLVELADDGSFETGVAPDWDELELRVVSVWEPMGEWRCTARLNAGGADFGEWVLGSPSQDE